MNTEIALSTNDLKNLTPFKPSFLYKMYFNKYFLDIFSLNDPFIIRGCVDEQVLFNSYYDNDGFFYFPVLNSSKKGYFVKTNFTDLQDMYVALFGYLKINLSYNLIPRSKDYTFDKLIEKTDYLISDLSQICDYDNTFYYQIRNKYSDFAFSNRASRPNIFPKGTSKMCIVLPSRYITIGYTCKTKTFFVDKRESLIDLESKDNEYFLMRKNESLKDYLIRIKEIENSTMEFYREKFKQEIERKENP